LLEVCLNILNYPTLILNESGHPLEFEQNINQTWGAALVIWNNSEPFHQTNNW